MFHTMAYWLIKSEPNVFSWDDLIRIQRDHWDGIRNYQARNNLMAMKTGELCLFYHSNIGKEIVGIAQVVREHYPDPTDPTGVWAVVDVVPVKAFNTPVTLAEIKATPALSEMALLKQSRLSVVPIDANAFALLLTMGKTAL
jgi:predicted RNA-binding protein with PUA-like domain